MTMPETASQGEKEDKKSSKPNHSVFADLLRFLSTVKGDLANITAPPFFLAPSSVVENPRCWAQRPKVFAAPSLEPSAEKRSLLVLQLFLVGLRPQLYIAGSPGVSIKKPLNAFLGELFLASWTDDDCTTRLVSEQVSHHPPITAMHLADTAHGVRADGYARVEMTFTTSINIRQIGHTILHIDRFDEDYVLPLPDVQVRGLLSACFYPEITGTYRIISSSGYTSEIKFSGSGFIRGARNQFEASIFHHKDPKTRLYEISGVWSESWIIKDSRTGKILEPYRVDAPENQPSDMKLELIEEQDPWESRRAWRNVIEELKLGNLRAAAAAKNKLEEAQRRMRKQEKDRGETWRPLLFHGQPGTSHQTFHDLTKGIDWSLMDAQTKGVWRIDDDLLARAQKPYRGSHTPM
ncbi:oxysterol-binding [Fusarium albosuccineum]|uniref:Oxysterol-binding n=1 Tax=Fusarium albosuccineum TaxID=1237068 RepID=A0A8H4LB86_9HYPO|nr:oxysterol-binding [Fusarium albosuccineum]